MVIVLRIEPLSHAQRSNLKVEQKALPSHVAGRGERVTYAGKVFTVREPRVWWACGVAWNRVMASKQKYSTVTEADLVLQV